MAVQQNRKSRSRRDMRRSHDRMSLPTISIDAGVGTEENKGTGVKHLRHHATADGFYRGRQLNLQRRVREAV